jgi:hypothetical protein
MSRDFDWSDRETVIVPEQTATALYINPNDDIVIRQKGDPYDDDGDHWFILAPNNALRLAYAIIDLVHELEGTAPALPAPAPTGNAERQRRYRQNKRNGVTPPATDDVTRNDSTVTEETPPLLFAAE